MTDVDAEIDALKKSAPDHYRGRCDKCGRIRTVYNTGQILDWTADSLALRYECGTCQHRQARRINATDGRISRRGY